MLTATTRFATPHCQHTAGRTHTTTNLPALCAPESRAAPRALLWAAWARCTAYLRAPTSSSAPSCLGRPSAFTAPPGTNVFHTHSILQARLEDAVFCGNGGCVQEVRHEASLQSPVLLPHRCQRNLPWTIHAPERAVIQQQSQNGPIRFRNDCPHI